jgi:CubicO group peptidase (beta-lactamase class C family)
MPGDRPGHDRPYTREMIAPLARPLAATLLLWAMALAASADAQVTPSGAALADVLAKFDAYAESSRQRWGVPGMAVAVIQGKTMAFSKGYGVRVRGEPAPVDTSTVFQIGSISKSFTATVMGTLVDEGKTTFEDRVIDRYPGFQMYDPWVTREFMIWDLMAQHSGMAPYAGDSAISIGFTRQDFIGGLRHLKPVSSFRSEFAYVNNLWLVVAALQEALTGRKWEDLVAERVFRPLGMTSATTSAKGLLEGANAALPHVLVGGVPTPTRADFWDIEAVYTLAPAGGINASVVDMASYVIAHLNRGAFRDKVLLKPETARWLHEPKTIITVKGPANVQRGAAAQAPALYCQGFIRQLLSPTPLVWHNGGTIGSKAVVAFTPDGDLGLVVLSNLDGTELPEALMYYLYDLYYARPEKDYTAAFLDEAKAKAEAGKFPSPPANPVPGRDLAAYAGAYRSAYFGPLTAAVQDGSLVLSLGPRKTPVRLRHWSGDTFAIALPGYGPPTYTDGFATFAFGEGTTARELRFIRGFDDADGGRFTRAADR